MDGNWSVHYLLVSYVLLKKTFFFTSLYFELLVFRGRENGAPFATDIGIVGSPATPLMLTKVHSRLVLNEQ
jgi:hypothetical protein